MSTKDTMIKNRFNGSEEEYLKYMRKLAKKGGEKKVLKGWAKRKANREAGIENKPVQK